MSHSFLDAMDHGVHALHREFDLGEMGIHLAERAVHFYGHLQHDLHTIGRVVKKVAQSEFGHYQPKVGPHPVWPELADSTKEQRVALGFTENDPLLRTGDLRDSIEYEVQGLEVVIGSKDPRMEWQEFGTATIPARPVLGPAAFRMHDTILSIVGHVAVSGITHGAPIHRLLGYDFETPDPLD